MGSGNNDMDFDAESYWSQRRSASFGASLAAGLRSSAAVAKRVEQETVTTTEELAMAPKRAAYGEEEYWEKRYRSESDADEFDWLCVSRSLSRNPSRARRSDDDADVQREVMIVGKVLHVGCGTSTVGPEMIRQGLCEHVVNMDTSASCVERMRDKFDDIRGCEWVVGDAMNMEGIGDETIELVLDKGTLDALACKEGGDEVRLPACRAMVEEAHRVLRPGGTCVIASFGSPQTRWKYIRGYEGASEWAEVRHESVRVEASGSELHVYTLKKAPRRRPVSLLDGRVVGTCEEMEGVLLSSRRTTTFEVATWVLGIALCAVAITLGLASARRRTMAFSAVPEVEKIDPLAPPGGTDDKGAAFSAAQCNYDLLRSFAAFTHQVAPALRWTLGAGTLLGALRTEPAGLLRWERDVDLYVPAKDALDLARRLEHHCSPASSRWHQRACGALAFRGFVDSKDEPCCGFGFKVYHAKTDACQLDVLVLAKATHAPWVHQETTYWPFPWGPYYATAREGLRRRLTRLWTFIITKTATPATDSANTGGGDDDDDDDDDEDDDDNTPSSSYFVIPEDYARKTLLAGPTEEAWEPAAENDPDLAWLGPPVSYFHAEYFAANEFEPIRKMALYDLLVNVPNDPWASLNRTYGDRCSYIARVDAHGGFEADLRKAEHAHLMQPARVVTGEPRR